MRAVVLVVLVAAVAGGCTDQPSAATPTGCGLVPARMYRGLLGEDTTSSLRGSVPGLRDKHAQAVCRTVAAGHPERFVTVDARFHPAPVALPVSACSAGWVYAGTPEKNAPACQQFGDGNGRTHLIVRWGDYVMRVTVGRHGRDWAGDPELALEMSRQLALRLGIDEAADAA